MKLILCFLFLFSAEAFSQSRQQRHDRAEIDRLINKAERLSANDLFCRHHSDCVVLPIGARACGGPNGFLLTSRFSSKLHQIEVTARKATRKEERYNEKYHIISSCVILMPPDPSCVKKVCQKGMPYLFDVLDGGTNRT